MPEIAATAIWDETIEPGEYAAHRLPRGAYLRLTDLEGDACAHVIVHNARQPAERLNLADTVKVQWQAYPTTGSRLLSDMGRALLTITADTCGTARRALRRAQPASTTRRSTATARCRARTRTPVTGSIVAALKSGLERRDVGPSITFFKGARVGADGALELGPEPGTPGAEVALALRARRARRHREHPARARPAPGLSLHRAAGHRVEAADRRPDESDGRADARDRTSAAEQPRLARRPRMSTITLEDVEVGARHRGRASCPAGGELAIIDLDGNQAVDCLLYNPHDPAERYSAPDTIVAQGNIFLTTGLGAALERGPPDDAGGRGHLRPPRHHRRRVQPGVEHAPLRVPHEAPARVRRELPPRGLAVGAGQARHVEQHQLVHERAGRAGRHARHRRRDLRARAARSTAWPRWTCSSLVSNCPQINNPCNGFDPTPIRIVVSGS